jgi:pseudouridine-5'-phosphate glycosidase
VRVHPEVAAALSGRGGVVALESTIIAHGLPRPDNFRVAAEIEDEVRAGGAVPATVAVVDGVPCVGLDEVQLRRIAESDDVLKASLRDLAPVIALRRTAATTVAATAHLAAQAGVRIFATGGLGGVHRGARETWDESADLDALSRTDVVVVCSGVKSILDVPATLERMETLNVGVVGYRTDAFPGFYLRDSGQPVPWRADTVAELAAIVRARAEADLSRSALVVANPVPRDDELDRGLHDRVLRAAEDAAADVHGKAVTPFVLDYFHRHTGGASLRANVALVRANARLAGELAAALR